MAMTTKDSIHSLTQFLVDTREDLAAYKDQREALTAILPQVDDEDSSAFVENEIALQDRAIDFLVNREARFVEAMTHLSDES